MRTAPDYIQFYPTLRCNRSCDFCFNKNIPVVSDMEPDRFHTMLGFLTAAGVKTIDIMGGEPMLHGDIACMVREAERSGFSLNLSSNGTDLEALAGILATSTNTTIGISINDLGALAPLKEFIGKHNPVLKSIFRADLDLEMIEDILSLHPKKFYLLFRDVMHAGDLKGSVPFNLFYRAITTTFDPSRVGMVYCSGFFPDTESYPGLAHVRCPAGTAKLGVLPDGSVYPCNLFFGIEQFRLGNILTDPFEKIWKSAVLSFFRSFVGNACPRTGCELHALCHGGCPAHSLVHFGDLAAPDPRCIRKARI